MHLVASFITQLAGNLCVDVVVHVPQLPATGTEVRKALLKQLSQKHVLQTDLEVGGNCNFLVAAARLGLRVAAVGHTGNDQFGKFLVDVLQVSGCAPGAQPGCAHLTHAERTAYRSMAHVQAEGRGCAVHPMGTELTASARDATLVCFVLVDPSSQHAFCSSYDFGPWPLLPSITSLAQGSSQVRAMQLPCSFKGVSRHCHLQVLSSSRALFTNGYIFDEHPVSLIQATVTAAADSGVAVFFDPGAAPPSSCACCCIYSPKGAPRI
jgi:hypothetical protein